MMHAYFVFGLTDLADPAYQQFQNAHALLFKKNGKPIYDGMDDIQHEVIANKYVNQMADLLYKYALSNNISAPANSGLSLLEYCKDLSWGGLIYTKAYRKYAPNKTRIEQNLENERVNNLNSTRVKGC